MTKNRILLLFLAMVICFSSCAKNDPENGNQTEENKPEQVEQDITGENSSGSGTPSNSSDITENELDTDTENDNEESVNKEEKDDSEEGSASQDIDHVTEQNIEIKYISGTKDCWNMEENTLTFCNVSKDSVYSLSGVFQGNIVIDIDDDHKFELILDNFSISSENENPLTVLSADKVTITAESNSNNYITDKRSEIDPEAENAFSGAIHAKSDLKLCGSGNLTVVSENNNGIHCKKDLQVKDLSLYVSCVDNALKGNNGVEISGGNTTLIATKGDCIKTSNSHISDKDNQKGTVSVTGGTHSLYSACDGIDSAYDVIIDGENTVLNIRTDKYSEYSQEITIIDEELYYIRFNYDTYKYSVKYYNSDEDFVWADAEYHSKATGGRTTYYYYSFPLMDGYSKIQYFIYDTDMETCREDEYIAATDYLTVNESYDTFALSVNANSLGYSFTNYTTTFNEPGRGGFGGGGFGGGGFGGMNDGNTDKGEYSTKGIKAGNQITINAGTVNIKSYDDSIHANNDGELENGKTPLGNVTVNGGNLTLYSNDDGIHTDGDLTVNDGTLCIEYSYEGLEGDTVMICGGTISINAADDGINATATENIGVEISGGSVYIYCSGDGIDSNSRTSYEGIIFSGGKTVVIANSNMNSAIDSERGYKYSGGSALIVTSSRGMTNEATNCYNFSEVATTSNINLTEGSFLSVSEKDSVSVSVKIPASFSAKIIYLGSNSAKISTSSSISETTDDNGVYWK